MGILLRQLHEGKNIHGKNVDLNKIPNYLKGDIINRMKQLGATDEDIDSQLNGEDDETQKFSLGSKDVNTTRDKVFPEKFDKEKLELIKKSENIVEEYKKYINFELDKIINRNDHEDIDSNVGVDQVIHNIYTSLIDPNQGALPKEKVRRYITESFFDISEDPKQIKQLLQLRINYNNRIITLLQKMLRINYQVLGISNDEANSMINNLSSSNSKISGSTIKQVKELILKNDKKFLPRPDMIDLRSLGFGVAFVTKEDLGQIEKYSKLDRVLHLLMRYDCIVLGHGSDMKREWSDNVDKKPDLLSHKNVEKNKAWSIQNIRTEHGGPYTDVNQLVRQLIKEGFKKIFLMSCNPGHYKLADDILHTKGVVIHSAENSLIAENFDIDENTEDDVVLEYLDSSIMSTEVKLLEFCESNDIDYYNDQILEEAFLYIKDNEDYIVENAMGDLWNTLKSVVKKILQGLIYLFKTAIEFVKGIFNKIRTFFSNIKSDNNSFKTKVSFITLESAQVKEVDVNNYNQLKAIILKSCMSINKEIDSLSQKQTMITKQTQSYIEKKGRESMDEMYDMSIIKPFNESVVAVMSNRRNDHDQEYGDNIIVNQRKEDEEEKDEDEDGLQEQALKAIRVRKEKYKEIYQELSDISNANNKITKSYSDTYLYSLVSDSYNTQLIKFINTAHEVYKKDPSFKDIEYDVKRRQTSNAIISILQSDNIVLMISENNLPLPKTFKVITATDIRPGQPRKKKVFIDVTGIITYENGVYKCNSRNVEILLSYLVNGALQFIYYADPKRIIMDRNMINEGAYSFANLFTYVIDYLVKVSVNGNMRDQIMYISAVYYLKTILNKDLTDSHFKLCKDISGLSDREIELLGIKFEDENYSNIKTFVHGISELCLNDKITLDVIVNKWIYLYGQGTQFALELFPAFTNMITNAYNGQFLNNQSAIEKQCGTHMVTFSKGVLNIIEAATK